MPDIIIFPSSEQGSRRGNYLLMADEIKEKGIQTMKIKENIISATNHCSDTSILNQLYNDTLKRNDNLQKSYNDWINQQTSEVFDLHMRSMMYENLFDDMCIAKSSIMEKYLDTPQGSLKEDTYHFGIDAHYYKFIVTETTENGETDIFERSIKINPQFVDDKNIILQNLGLPLTTHINGNP